MTSRLCKFKISDLHRFATSGLRRFKIPDLHRFATLGLRRFKIPDLHRFATSGLRKFTIPDLHRVNHPENSFHEFLQTRRFKGDRFFLNSPTGWTPCRCCSQQGYDHPRAACQQTAGSTSRVAVSLLFKEDNLAVKGGRNPGPRQ
jgi:hypothetical protein